MVIYLGYVWGIVTLLCRTLEYFHPKEMYGEGQSVSISAHCISKAFSYASGVYISHETFLTARF
jgi:hypothetical protein